VLRTGGSIAAVGASLGSARLNAGEERCGLVVLVGEERYGFVVLVEPGYGTRG